MSYPTKPTSKPSALKKGDCFGIIAPSEPLDSSRRDRIKAGEELLRSLGYDVRYGKHAFESYYYMAGKPEQRTEDFHEMIADSRIKAIMTAWGGKSSNQLIDLLDYDLIARNPKIISGFSDSTNLINAIYAKTGMVTFHGPDVLGKFAERPQQNITYFEKAFVSGNIGNIEVPDSATVFKHGEAEGILVGGNLSCFVLALMGTPYQPILQGAIFFWESGGRTAQEIDQILTFLRLCGVFKQISGMIVGELSGWKDKKGWNNIAIKDVVLSATSNYDFPIVHLPIFGHGHAYNVTLPVGCRALLQTHDLCFQILEDCVS
jgi:muramoyltetrapeptide carboxypeptidase